MEASGPTIFALATGSGRTAVAVIRISGPGCASLIKDLCGVLPQPRRLSLRTLRDLTGEVLDRALVCWMPGPGTFTGEDMAELHLHGGLAVRTGVLKALSERPDCRPAEAGAFTRCAFVNGRMDLTEAEAAADLIEAETEAQRRQALRQLDGALGRQIAVWRDQMIVLLSAAEAALDFSDEGDVDDDRLGTHLHRETQLLHDVIASALRDDRCGERLREGYTVVLAGAPNAGKSTLLNTLAQRDVAIVSAIPGTTRDVIEVRCDLGGFPVILVDTAGLRDTDEAIEAEGIRRARSRMESADLVLHLREYRDDVDIKVATNSLLIRAKSDLAGAGSVRDGEIAVSALTGEGIDTLIDILRQRAETAMGGVALITRERHREALTRCQDHLSRFLNNDADAPPELGAEDLRLALRALGEVAGYVDVEEMLDRLFAGFCIGK